MAQTPYIFLQFMMIMSIISKTNSFTLKMVQIDSPHLQILPQHVTPEERHQFLVNISMSRLKNYPVNSSKLSPNSFKAPVFLAKSSFYVVKLAFGSGGGLLAPLLLLDTACEETWVQCEGCDPCMEIQRGKSFGYKASPSYARMSVDDPMCVPHISYDGSCGYDITFSGARTQGFVGRDNFYFPDAKTGQADAYPGLAFGCGFKNAGFQIGANTGPNSIIAGFHGLAPGPRSFLTQLSAQIKGRFAYCLVSWTIIRPSTPLVSQMYFGDDAQISGDATRTVRTISMHSQRRYHLYLNGISVDGTKLEIDPSVFELDPVTYEKGFFIDSGSPYTYLVRKAFDPLKDAIAKYFKDNYGWEAMSPSRLLFELCYSTYPKDDQPFPTVIFHFRRNEEAGDVDWVMDKDNMFQYVGDKQGFCMTLFGTDDSGPNLFGAFQQANFTILHDVNNGLLSFVPQKCQEVTL